MLKRVILESPYAGSTPEEIRANVEYAKRAMRDCIARREAAIASHLIWADGGILDEFNVYERMVGIECGNAWRQVAEYTVFYTDRGWSNGMLACLAQLDIGHLPYEVRALDGAPQIPNATTFLSPEKLDAAHNDDSPHSPL